MKRWIAVALIATCISIGGCTAEDPEASASQPQRSNDWLPIDQNGRGAVRDVTVTTMGLPRDAMTLADWEEAALVESTETGEFVRANPAMGHITVIFNDVFKGVAYSRSVVMYYDSSTEFSRLHSTELTSGVLDAADTWGGTGITYHAVNGQLYIDTIFLGNPK